MVISPHQQGVEDREQRSPGLGEPVFVARRRILVGDAIDDASASKCLEPGRDAIPRCAGSAHDITESG
jgi:hypothetical protein